MAGDVAVPSIDLKRTHKELYSGKIGEPVLLEIPELPYLMIDGEGDPNSAQEYADAVSALYPIAYAVRAAVKKATGDAYTVMPLEGLWWADDMEQFSVERKADWKWTMMITVPAVTTPEMADLAITETTKRKDLVAGHRTRFETLTEGLSAQVMHLGPYTAEAPTIELLHRFIADNGLELRGRHHEIYLGDPRKTAPEKLKTIIRQPAG